MKREDAEEFSQSLGQVVGGSWRQIALAKRLGVPNALGLSLDEWVNKHLGGYVKHAIEDRRKVVEELAAEGASTREIGAVVGVSAETVRRDLAATNVADDPPQDIDSATNVAEAAPLDAIAALAADERVQAQAALDASRAKNRETVAQIREQPVEVPAGRYRCIVIDPPWPTQKFEREVRPNQSAELDYPTMTMEEIGALDLQGLVADSGCHLFCWTTQKHLPETLSLIERWGFKYVLTMVWHKNGGPQPWGLPQYNCEFVVYARAGTPEFIDTKAFFACFTAPRRQHSRKPDEFYEVIKRVCDEPRLDWFSREARDGFAQLGNEPGRFAA